MASALRRKPIGRPGFLRVLLGVLAVVVAASTAAAQSRPPFEKVMREIQARHEFLTQGGTPIAWPACCSDGSTAAPDYPPDGFYGKHVSKACGAALTAYIEEKLEDVISSFLKPQYWDITGTMLSVSDSPAALTMADLGWSGASAVTEDNYAVWLDVFEFGIGLCEYCYREAHESADETHIGVACTGACAHPMNSAGYDTLAEAVAAAKASALGEWTSSTGGTHIEKREGACYTLSSGKYACQYTLWGVSGTIISDLTNDAPTTHAPSVDATVFIRVDPEADGESSTPPVTADTMWHGLFSGDGGDLLESDPIGTGIPDWSIGAPRLCDSATNVGWQISITGTPPSCAAVLHITFDPSADEAEACPTGRPIPAVKDTHGSKGEGNHGTQANCGAGAKGAGPGKGSNASSSKGGGKAGKGGAAGPNPEGPNPVELATGHKLERTTDLVVPLVGGTFEVVRGYSSNPDLDDAPGLVGPRWTLSLFTRIQTGEDTLELVSPPLKENLVFTQVSTDHWQTSGPRTQEITPTSITIGGNSVNVWRLTEPGGWHMDFIRGTGQLAGWLVEEGDNYGNVNRYEYEYYPILDDPTPGALTPRLLSVYLNGTSASNAEAQLSLVWNIPEDPEATIAATTLGRLAAIHVYRFDSARTEHLVQSVQYKYKEDGDSASGDVGTAGDLIQVVNRERVDRAYSEFPYRTQVTQYRYHDGETRTNTDERIAVNGGAHQLKQIINPEQIEYLAQQLHSTDSPPDAGVVETEALALLGHADTYVYTAPTPDIAVIDLPAKIVSYSSGKVDHQYLQSACGCAGGTQGLKQSFEYLSYPSASPPAATAKITEEQSSSGSYVAYRSVFYDMTFLGDIPYLSNYVVAEPSAGRKWVWHYAYDSSHNLQRAALPSALDSYSAAGASAASYAAKTDAGLVYAWVYSNNRETESRYAEGNLTSVSSFNLLSRTTYSSTRPWLATKIERFRGLTTGATDPDDDQVEVTEFDYGFFSSTDTIQWVKTSVEAESVEENGPGSPSTYDSYEVFDSQGQNIWSRDADGSLTHREFDPVTGMVTSVARNVSSSGLPSLAGLSTSGWGSLSSDGGSLTTTYAHDMLGRVTVRTGPGGVAHYTVREVRENDLLKGVPLYTEVSLPFALGTSPATCDGPATMTWYNAGDRVVRASDYTIGSGTYAPTSLAYTLSSDDVSRATRTYHLSGLLASSKAWARFAATGISEVTYETTYAYDALGRVKDVLSEGGTSAANMTRNSSYDVLGRVLEVQSGTQDSDLQTVASYFYDHTLDTGGDPLQGTGDGNLTFVRQHTAETGTGALSPEFRDTVSTYDFRGRMLTTKRRAGDDASSAARYLLEKLDYDNLDRVTYRRMYDDPSTLTAAHLGLEVSMLYSQRGLLYRQLVTVDPEATTITYLQSDTWYDASGRSVAEWKPNSGRSKRTFDGLGRSKAVYVTDGWGDPLPGASGNHAAAISVTNDRVMEQTEFTYETGTHPWKGEATLVSTFRRLHDADPDPTHSAGVGALSKTNAVATYVGFCYDAAGRRVRTVNFGDNRTDTAALSINGDPPSTWPPSTLPAFTDTVGLVSGVEFDDQGRFAASYDPTGQATKYLYDPLSRRIAVVENAVGSFTLGWSSSDGRWTVSTGLTDTYPERNRTTSFVYDAAGHVVLQVAHEPDGSSGEKVQQTKYNYATSVGSVSTDTNSLIASHDLVSSVNYPDESSGAPNTDSDHTVSYAYDRLGQLRSVVDQNGTKHTYRRDHLGRVLSDTVAFASGTVIDNTVKRIDAAYDNFGRLFKVTSYSDTSASTILNQVQMGYTRLWQVRDVFQDASGVVDISGGEPQGTTRVVRYAYEDKAPVSGSTGDLGSNYSRLTSVKYPNGTEFVRGYDKYSGEKTPEARLSLPVWISQSGSEDTKIVQYHRLGTDMFAVADYGLADVQLDRTFSQDGKRRSAGHTSQDAGVYPGWDRFGRVSIQPWLDGGLDVADTSPPLHPTVPPIVDEAYEYDRASNRTSRADARPGVSHNNPSGKWIFKYDGLHRLTEAKRGWGTDTSWAWGAGSQKWALDTLGDWNSTLRDTAADGTYAAEEDRDHDAANQLTHQYPSGTGHTPDLPFAYDKAGNTRDLPRTASLKDRYTHDAWNRLVKYQLVDGESAAVTVATYEYNGLHWRVRKTAYDAAASTLTVTQVRTMYYSAAWQVLEEDIDDDPGESNGVDRIALEVWGVRYIDDPVLRRILAGDSLVDHYHLTDAQFSTVAMTGTGSVPELRERVEYDAYGQATHRWPTDVDRDGYAASADADLIKATYGMGSAGLGQTNYDANLDLNRDGVVDATDQDLASAGAGKGPLTPGWISDPAGPDNIFGFDGYVFDRESGLYCVRFRWYEAGLGRWIERDPASYIDGCLLYQFNQSDPVTSRDPLGLKGGPEDYMPGSKILKWTECMNDWGKENRKQHQERIKQRLKQLRKNGISTTSDFIFWYQYGGGDAIQVSPSLEKHFREHELVAPVIEAIKNQALKQAAAGIPCGVCEPEMSFAVPLKEIRASRTTVSGSRFTTCLGNPWRDTYSYGKGFVWADIACRVTIKECGSVGGQCQPIKLKIRCNASMRADDKFEEPVGIPTELGGDTVGDPYWFTTRWNESFEGTVSISDGKMSASCGKK